MRQARVARLVVRDGAVPPRSVIPLRAVGFKERRSAVCDLAAPHVADRGKRVVVPPRLSHRLKNKEFVERRVRKAVDPVGEEFTGKLRRLAFRKEACIDRVGAGVEPKLPAPAAAGLPLRRFPRGPFPVLPRLALSPKFGQNAGEPVPRPDGEELVGSPVLRDLRVLEAGAEALVPSEEVQPGIRSVNLVGMVQPPAGAVQKRGRPVPVPRVAVVVDQAENPIELVAFDPVGVPLRKLQIAEHEVVIRKGNERRGLRGVGVAGPRIAVAPVDQDRGEIVLFQIDAHIVRRGSPDPVEHPAVAAEAAVIIDRLRLADETDARDVERFPETGHAKETEANALVKLVVQFKPVGGGAVFFRRGRLRRRLRPRVDKGGPVVFADAELHGSAQIRAVDFKPPRKFGAEIQDDGPVSGHLDVRPLRRQGRQIAETGRILRRGPDRPAQEDLQVVLRPGVAPAVTDQRIGRGFVRRSGKAARRHVGVRFGNRRRAPDRRASVRLKGTRGRVPHRSIILRFIPPKVNFGLRP